jgi:FG-GAP repeat
MQPQHRPRARSPHLRLTSRPWSWSVPLTGLAVVLAALIIPATAAAGTAAAPAAAPARPQAGRVLPVAALAPVSRALGRDDPAYRATTTTRGLTAANPRQRLRAQFTRGGMRVRSGPLAMGLGLRGTGYGHRLAAVRPVTPVAAGNLVTFRYGRVREWFANGSAGLEQGFTLTAPPPGPAGGPLTLAMTLSGTARAALLPGREGVVFSGAGRALAYRGLVASDAAGRRLPAWLGLAGRQLLLHVQARGARYPLTVDPVIQQARLTASDGVAGDSLGSSVAISADGTTIVAGAPGATIGGNPAQGAVYVFVKPAGGWQDATQTAKLTASDGAALDNLGSGVTQGANGVGIFGNTIVAGAPGSFGSAPGAVYVFAEPAGGWHDMTETAKLTASDAGPQANLGTSVAISGNVIVSGAPFATVHGTQAQGAVYVFTKPTGGWHDATQAAKLTASDGTAGSFLGNGVAMSVSGRTVVTNGATTVNGSFQDAVYVFTEPGDGWQNETQAAKLTASGENPSDFFATSLAMSGQVVIVGAPGVYVNGNQFQGAAYLYAEPRTGWHDMTQTAELTDSPGAPFDLLGASVAILGRTAVAGGAGAAWVFAEPPGGWQNQTQTAELTNPDLGCCEALAPGTLVAGAPFATVKGNQFQGAVDVYTSGPNGIGQLAAAQASRPVPRPRAASCLILRRLKTPPHPTLRLAAAIRKRCR